MKSVVRVLILWLEMTFCQKDFFFYKTFFLATKIVDKNQCEIGCSSLPWDIGYGKMPFLKDFEVMFKNDFHVIYDFSCDCNGIFQN